MSVKVDVIYKVVMYVDALRIVVNYLHIVRNMLNFRTEVKWVNAFVIFTYHIAGLLWCYLYALPAKWQTLVFAGFMVVFSGLGITVAIHRYWSHRSFKATALLRVLLMTMYLSAGQNSIVNWVRDHRVHHKYSDTDADPHNVNRGFFFSHIGWLMMRKHPEVVRRGKEINLADLHNDPLVMWQERHFGILKLLCCFVLPTMAGIWCWGENWRCAVAWQCFFRYIYVGHCEMSINSFAHIYGYRPFNRNIKPTKNWLTELLTLGEGNHNYHHVFPQDYKHSEPFVCYNVCARFVELCEGLGLAYDLKEANPESVEAVAKRLGDGSHSVYGVEDSDEDDDGNKSAESAGETVSNTSSHID